MEKIEYRLCENQLKAEDFIRLKVATGFRDFRQVFFWIF